MPCYSVEMQHSEETFKALAHMQYDLFCRRNRLSRNLVTVVAITVAIANLDSWWAYPLIGYGWYLHASTYASANNTARKLARSIQESGMSFPKSCYQFGEESMTVLSLPEGEVCGEPLVYTNVAQLGEDLQYLYLFRDRVGGYMIPKDSMESEELKEFRKFIQDKTQKVFIFRGAPASRMMGFFRNNRKR